MASSDAVALARVYAGVGRWDDALRALGPALAANADDADALLLASTCYLELRDPQRALLAANAASASRPDAATSIAQSQALSALKRHREARDAAERARRLEPADLGAHLQRAGVDAASRRVTQAGIASAEAALRIAPNEPAAHVTAGNLDFARGRGRDAAEHYEDALRIDPDNRAAQYNLALLSQRAGGSAEGVRLLLGLIRADPADPRYPTLLRSQLSIVLIFAGLACAIAALFATPGGGRPEPSAVQMAVAFVVSVVLQAAAVIRLRTTAGSAVFRFLASGGLRGGWRSAVLVVGAAAVLAADACLLAGVLFVPIAGTLAGVAMVLAMIAVFLVAASLFALKL